MNNPSFARGAQKSCDDERYVLSKRVHIRRMRETLGDLNTSKPGVGVAHFGLAFLGGRIIVVEQCLVEQCRLRGHHGDNG